MVYQFTAYSYIELFSAVVVALLLGMVASRPWERSAPPLIGLAASVLVYVATTTFRQAGLIPSVTLLWTQLRYLAEVVIAPSAILFSLSCCIADVRRKPVVAAILATASSVVLVVQEAAALHNPSSAISDTAAAMTAGLVPVRFDPLGYLSAIYLVAGLSAALAISFITLFQSPPPGEPAVPGRVRRGALVFAIALVLAGYLASRAGYSGGSAASASAAAFVGSILFALLAASSVLLFLADTGWPGGSGAPVDRTSGARAFASGVPVSVGLSPSASATGAPRVREIGFAALFQTMSEGAVVLDAAGCVVAFNIESVVAFPALDEHSRGRVFAEIVGEEPDLLGLLTAPQGGQADLVVDSGERPRYFEVLVTPITGDRGETVGRLVHARNVTRQFELLDEVKALMIRDPLTGVYSRRHFDELAAHEVERLRRTGGAVSMMRLDIDRFDAVKTQAGRAEADALLRKIAHACQRSIRSADILCRSGSDGFLALLCDTPPADAESAAARLLSAASSIASAPGAVPFTVSIGVSGTVRVDGTALGELVRDAEHALAGAKESGGNRVVSDGK